MKKMLILLILTLFANAKNVNYDFNGDGNADILIKKGNSNYLWYMKSNATHRSKRIKSLSTSYKVAGIGDFNDDGTSDILWRNPNTGINYIWYMKPNGKHTYKKIAKSLYNLEAVADFNGDGISDILWKKGSKNYIWYMSSNGKHKSKNIGSKNTDYRVAGVADFNGDNKADILWKQFSKNRYSIWYMDSKGKHKYKYIGKKSYSYRVVGVADFNGDKKADILWENKNKYSLWFMKSNGKHTYKDIGSKPISYAVLYLADFNGDSKADILWKKGSHTSIWYMNSNGKHTYKKVANLSSRYTIQTPQYNLNKKGYSRISNSKHSIRSIKAFYFKETGATSWGKNLWNGRLQPNYYIGFTHYNCNKNYDLKVVYTDNKILSRKKVYLECDARQNYRFTLYKSTIPDENINCSIDGKNKMLYDIMTDSYFWYKKTPYVDYEAYNSLEKLLDKLKYKKYDKWSYITTTKAYTNYFEEGTYLGLGYSYRYASNKKLYFTSVYKNSPAYKAGIRRGTELLEINGKTIKEIDKKNLWSKIYGKNELGIKVKLKIKKGSKSKTITLRKSKVKKNTVLTTKIIKSGNKKIGYLVFNSFIEPSRLELRKAFYKFKKEHIDELILDLRYNGGGRVNIAQYLASLIGGKKTVDNVFETLIYNDNYSHWDYTYKFTEEKYSLGLSRVYIITTNGTASASESVINGLKPFLNVKLIGSKTHGKPVGMRGYNFCGKHLSPIQFTGVNASDNGNYFKGFKVTCDATDDITRDFGNSHEEMLKESLYLIKHGKCSDNKYFKSSISKNNTEEKNRELYQGFSAEIGAF